MITKYIEIQCPECGGTEFEQAREIVIPEAKKEIENMIKKAFKGRLK